VNGTGYLLLRRAGGLFGVASRAVRGLTRSGGAFRIEVEAGVPDLLADEVVGVVEALDIRPVAPLVRRFWPEPADGWAVHGGSPVVVVDPRRPPRALAEGDRSHGQ
jgi:hypothetical protein